MRILIIGQCTLHWGRMEFGNIGNYYIIKPFFQQLRRVFPNASIATTMQFSSGFCEEYDIVTLPMEMYYDFNSETNLESAIKEYESAKLKQINQSAYIKEVMKSDLVIDFSGDIWGKNADFLGKDRFLTGCYKDLTAQQYTKTAMLAGSPGPFHDNQLAIAKEAYAGFDLVTNREPVSTELLHNAGFDLSNTLTYACPSFLFDKASDAEILNILKKISFFYEDKPVVGFIMCGWNFERGPFDLWPREDYEYENVIKLLEYIIDQYQANILLLSHSNGFIVPPKPFELIHGRDFPIAAQIKDILDRQGYGSKARLLDGIYTPEQTKAIISHFDFLISGRMHGAVAGLSQNIPTLLLDYGHEPKAHKLQGFAKLLDIEQQIANPNDLNDMLKKVNNTIKNQEEISKKLRKNNKLIMESAITQFDALKRIV